MRFPRSRRSLILASLIASLSFTRCAVMRTAGLGSDTLRSETIATEQGNRIQYLMTRERERYRITWGNARVYRTTTEWFDSGGDGEPADLWWESSYALVLQDSCGSSCWFAIVLPLNETDAVRTIWYPYASDASNNLIAYLGEETDRTVLEVENLATRERRAFELSPTCSAPFRGWCIEQIEFRAGTLYVQWSVGDGVEGRRPFYPAMKETEIPLDGLLRD